VPGPAYLIEDQAPAAAERTSKASGRLRPTAAGDNSRPASQAGTPRDDGTRGRFSGVGPLSSRHRDAGRRSPCGIRYVRPWRTPRRFAEPRPDRLLRRSRKRPAIQNLSQPPAASARHRPRQLTGRTFRRDVRGCFCDYLVISEYKNAVSMSNDDSLLILIVDQVMNLSRLL
jgi:hypothetical protein